MLRVNACASANSYAQRTSNAPSGTRPASRAIRSSTPLSQSGGGDGVPGGGAGKYRRATTFIASRSFRSGGPPHLDYDCRAGPRHAPGFPERRSHVACEEECVEPRDDIEAVVLVGEELQVAPAQVGIGHAGARKLQQRLPHRAKYLRLANEFLRRLVDLHVQLVDDVERELAEVEDRGS
jgi:hypothetical protein